MNFGLKCSSKTVFLLLFFMLSVVIPIHGAACAEEGSNVATAPERSKDPIVDFYASRLPNYHAKFVAAACLAVERDPVLGKEYLQEWYQADLAIAVSGKKTTKESDVLKTLRQKCERFKATYQSHPFWRRYGADDVKTAVESGFNMDAITPNDVLECFESDRENLSRGYEYLILNPVRVAGHRISRLAQALFLQCELNKHYEFFERVVSNRKDAELDENAILAIPAAQVILQKMKNAYKSDFEPYFFCAAVKIAEQQNRVSIDRWRLDEQANKVIDAYEVLADLWGQSWKEDKQFAAFARPFLARISLSSCLAESSFIRGTYGVFSVRRALYHFFKDYYVKDKEQRLRKSDQEKMAQCQDILREKYEDLVSDKRMLFGLESEFARLNNLRGYDLKQVELGMQSFINWTQLRSGLESRLWSEYDNQVVCLMDDSVAKLVDRKAAVEAMELRNIDQNNLALQRRYFAIIASFARKQQLQRDQLSALQKIADIALQRNVICALQKNVSYQQHVRLLREQQNRLSILEEQKRAQLVVAASALPRRLRLDARRVLEIPVGGSFKDRKVVIQSDPYCQ